MRNHVLNVAVAVRDIVPTVNAVADAARMMVTPMTVVLARHRALLGGLRAIEQATVAAGAAGGAAVVIAAGANRDDTHNAS